jgi:hypothetical protein
MSRRVWGILAVLGVVLNWRMWLLRRVSFPLCLAVLKLLEADYQEAGHQAESVRIS